MVENVFVLDSEHVGKGEKSISTEWGGDKFQVWGIPHPPDPPPSQRISVIFFSLYNFSTVIFHSKVSLCNVVYFLVILCLKLHKLLIP